MKLSSLKLLSVALVFIWPSYVNAQIAPNHFDVNTREQTVDSNSVPAMRFLTTPDFPPFNYRDDGGELVGFNIDLAEEICSILEIVCTMQAWPWQQASDALADKQGDVLLAGLALNEQNATRFDFSHIYLKFPARFVTRQVSAVDFSFPTGQVDENDIGTPPAAFSGPEKSFSVRAGSSHEKYLAQFFPNLKIIAYDSEFEALDALKNESVYAFFGDAMRSSFWLNEHVECCVFVFDAYFNAHYFGQGLAAAFPIGQTQTKRAINAALFRLKHEGVLDELYLRWFPVGFY